MHAACFDYPLQKWFDFKVPRTTVQPDYISKALEEEEYTTAKPTAKIVWLGKKPIVENFTKSKKGYQWEMVSLTFQGRTETVNIKVDKRHGEWLTEMLQKLAIDNINVCTLQEVKDSYEAAGLEDFELFWDNKPVNSLHRSGLLIL